MADRAGRAQSVGEVSGVEDRRTRNRWRAVAPGRVNLIGEHTDYNGLPVLPIAIDRAVRIDFRVTGDAMVELRSPVAPFAPFAFQLKRPIEAAGRGDWSNYVRAAALGLLEHGVELRRGIEGTVSGDVPIASGLSSSSALVVASALALLKANGVEVGDGMGGGGEGGVGSATAGLASDEDPADEHRSLEVISRMELAALMARSERFVGLQGGGMDQAACLCGVAGHALRIAVRPAACDAGGRAGGVAMGGGVVASAGREVGGGAGGVQ